MNKDVIYIEPEDDITDIIAKIENSKEKIVALVPPKKAGVFRSVVNIKLISKVGTTSEKNVVLVTTDPSIVKLAAAARILVTKNLQTPPAIPTAETEIAELAEEEVIDGPDMDTDESEDTDPDDKASSQGKDDGTKSTRKSKKDKKKDEQEEDEEGVEDEKKAKKATKPKSGNPVINWIKSHKKTAIFGGVAALALIIFLVWAFAIAPAATVTVGIKTENNNFSENVTFTTNADDENAAEGKFYLQEKKIETVSEVTFEASGQKNNGERASGEVTVMAIISYKGGTKVINTGDTFTYNGLSYKADNSVTMSFDGENDSVCSNVNDKITLEEFKKQGCRIYAKVKVTATAPGAAYNISAQNTGWNTTADVVVSSDSAMTGGTDDIVTVVEQIDIEKAKDKLKASNEEEEKQKLYESIGDSMLVIDSSFNQDTAAAVATPAAGEEVKQGVTPTLKATTTATVYIIDKAKVEEFIKEKANIGDDQKIYEIKDPYIENFVRGDNGYAGRLKTSYAIGPKVTENDIVEMIKGKGIGDAQHDLKNINGIVSVSIDTSYPWVSSIPGDTNKITVNIEMKDGE